MENKSRESVWLYSIWHKSHSRRYKCRFVNGKKIEIFQRVNLRFLSKIGNFEIVSF